VARLPVLVAIGYQVTWPVIVLYLSDELGELSHWQCHDDGTV